MKIIYTVFSNMVGSTLCKCISPLVLIDVYVVGTIVNIHISKKKIEVYSFRILPKHINCSSKLCQD